MFVHQVYISEGDRVPPPILMDYMDSVKNHHDGFEYRVYQNDQVRGILDTHFGNDVLWAYDTLVPYSYKVDLAKYCILYHFGGWYFDCGVYPEFQIVVGDKTSGVFFTDSLDTSNGVWRIAASVLYTTSKREALKKAIDQVIQNCKEEYYGEDALCPTSTALLGKVMPKEYFDNSIILGDGKMMPMPNGVLRKALTLDGDVFSWYKEGGGDLAKFGARGTNNYNYLWGNRLIYSKK